MVRARTYTQQGTTAHCETVRAGQTQHRGEAANKVGCAHVHLVGARHQQRSCTHLPLGCTHPCAVHAVVAHPWQLLCRLYRQPPRLPLLLRPQQWQRLPIQLLLPLWLVVLLLKQERWRWLPRHKPVPVLLLLVPPGSLLPPLLVPLFRVARQTEQHDTLWLLFLGGGLSSSRITGTGGLPLTLMMRAHLLSPAPVKSTSHCCHFPARGPVTQPGADGRLWSLTLWFL